MVERNAPESIGDPLRDLCVVALQQLRTKHERLPRIDVDALSHALMFVIMARVSPQESVGDVLRSSWFVIEGQAAVLLSLEDWNNNQKEVVSLVLHTLQMFAARDKKENASRGGPLFTRRTVGGGIVAAIGGVAAANLIPRVLGDPPRRPESGVYLEQRITPVSIHVTRQASLNISELTRWRVISLGYSLRYRKLPVALSYSVSVPPRSLMVYPRAEPPRPTPTARVLLPTHPEYTPKGNSAGPLHSIEVSSPVPADDPRLISVILFEFFREDAQGKPILAEQVRIELREGLLPNREYLSVKTNY